MSKPTMSPGEFVDAINDLSKRTGRTPVALAEALGGRVEIRAAERPVSDAERSARMNALVLLARQAGISVTEAQRRGYGTEAA